MPKSYQEFMKEKYPNFIEYSDLYKFGLEVWEYCVNNFLNIKFEYYTIRGEKHIRGTLDVYVAEMKLNFYGKDDIFTKNEAKKEIQQFLLNKLINRK